MNNDRELLELAAKAAGYKVLFVDVMGGFIDSDGEIWSPLKDDGDALRLAVRLELDLFHSCISVRAMHRRDDMGAAIRCRGNNPQMDPYAATRRAIVRAAAEIGRTM